MMEPMRTGRNGGTRAPDIDLYMMGLIDAEAVSPIRFLKSDAEVGCIYDDLIVQPDIHIETEVTIDDILAVEGRRTPGPEAAPKDFRLAFVAESRGRMLNAVEMTYYHLLAQHSTREVPSDEPDPYLGKNWVPITRYFGEDVTWRSDLREDPIERDVIIDIPITASSDDAEEHSDSTVNLNRKYLNLTSNRQNRSRQIGLRFDHIAVAQGQKIASAHIAFYVDQSHAADENQRRAALKIFGEAEDDALAFAEKKRNISSRRLTNEFVRWSPSKWSYLAQPDPPQRTPDISSVIQEIIDRPGWQKGNSLAIMIRGKGIRTAESFDEDPAKAPVLHLEFVEKSSRALAK